jgi:hypothetical protein
MEAHAISPPSLKARRLRPEGDPLRKTGWQVRTSVADAVRQAVAEGAAESQNALVERAILRHLAELKREILYEAYAEAAKDPVFMDEMREVSAEFDSAVTDGLED